MAKKDYDKIHRANMDVYARKIQAIYDSAIKEASTIGMTVGNFDPEKLFSFKDYPITAIRVDKLVKSLQSNIETVVLNGIDHEWTLSNNKNSELSRRVFGDNLQNLTKEQQQRYFNNNHNARDAFKGRKTVGLGLSDRVWQYADGFKEEIALGIDVGLRDRLSAAEMSRNMREYLQNPEKLFRRVRDEHGVLKLSKAAKAFKPGQGVYRSSAKNAERLARTETNMAYRTADHERWQQFDFVVGIEVRRSNNRSCHCPMCDSLAGKYPKDFKFTGWHPQCRCHAIPILKTIDELQQETEQIIQGVPTSSQSVNSVDALPDGYNEWIEQNKGRFGADNTPYFIRDNYKGERISEGLKTSVLPIFAKPSPLDIAAQRHALRTPEQAKDIQDRWDERKNNLNDNIEEYCDKHRNHCTFIDESQNGYDRMQDAHLPNLLENWNISTMDSRQAIVNYTGNDYADINRSYWKDTKPCLLGSEMDKILDKCSLSQDTMLRRGTRIKEVRSIFGDDFADAMLTGDESAMAKFVGHKGVNEAFISTTINADGGFDDAVEFIFFAPKGTKAIFAQPFSKYGGKGMSWDGVSRSIFNATGENEFIVHRGYQYRLTKTIFNAKRGKYQLHVDLITREARTVK